MSTEVQELSKKVAMLEKQIEVLATLVSVLAKRDNVALMVALKATAHKPDEANEQLAILQSTENDIERIVQGWLENVDE
ncbi:hypothetical protein [Nioella sp.]|uniref:hypothetical protein n=1 Tax=Nioella sp. TaxID=1912091 RepID=UPI003B5285CA